MTRLAAEVVHFSFEPEAGANTRDSTVEISVSRNLEETAAVTPHAVVMMGLGNEHIAPLAAKRLSKIGRTGIVSVDGLPYWDCEPSQVGFDRMVVAATEAIHDYLEANYGVKGALDTIGESQGMYAALLAANEQPEFWDDMALLRPVGFQGPISKARFTGRMLATGLRPSVAFDRATMPVAIHAAYRAAQDQIRAGGKGLSYALGFDAFPRLDSLVKANEGTDRRVGVFAAENDLVFPPSEIEHGLGKYAYLMYTIEGPHCSTGSKGGTRQVAVVDDWLQTGEVINNKN